MDNYFDDPLKAPPEREDEFLEVNHIHTLGDLVDAHGSNPADLEITTRGLDTADLNDDDPLKDIVGFPGTFSDDGIAGTTVDDALAPEFNDADELAGEFGPDDEEAEDDPLQASRLGGDATTLEEQAVLSGGVGNVRIGAALPTGFQIEDIGTEEDNPSLINERGEPDFAREEAVSGDVTPASGRGLGSAETEDDIHGRDVTEGT